MLKMDFLVLALAALVPLVVGFIWYSKMLFANAWMVSAGLTEEQLKGANMAKIFILCYIFSLMLAMILQPIVIHQFGMLGTLMNEPGFKEGNGEAMTYFQNFMTTYGSRFRSFHHGLLHGSMTGLFIGLPILGTTALFERKGFKYIAINVGYWIISLGLMGGIICQFAKIQ